MSFGATGAAPSANCTKCGKALKVEARFCTGCGTAIESTEALAVETANPAGHELFCEAIRVMLAKNSGIPAMPLLQKALLLGLSPRDQAQAHLALGEGYREIVGNSGLPWQKIVQASEFRNGILEIERALEIDRAGSLRFFEEPLNIGRLEDLDHMYNLDAIAKEKQEGTEAAIMYLAPKMRAIEHLSRPPLLLSLLRLAEFYKDTGAIENASKCLRQILKTEPLYPADEERNGELRGKAQEMLGEIQKQFRQSSQAPGAVQSQKRGINMTQSSADVHLKRAYGFIQEVEKATEDFRQSAVAHSAQVESDEPFLQGMVSTVRGNRQLKQQKTALANDLQLANQEVDRAVSLDADATVETADGTFGARHLRAFITYMSGQLEMIWGRSEEAKRILNNSLQIVEFPDAHYMLGLLHESDYQPAEALKHFERCLELDPSGELSVSALREANAMRNYKKKFRGSWLLFFILLLFYIVPGVIYFLVKRK
jgi:tetratricopeptide (TPR) repeat protein